VPCREVIGVTPFPYRSGGYRAVLDDVSVPPKRMAQVVRSNRGRWLYWRKAGLVVRAGAGPITVTVPRTWRSRAAITWGSGADPTSSLQIASCRGSAGTGHAYAGGFYLRARAACVPLVFHIRGRAATVRFGIGRRC
jgi:hypothetical protein